MEEDKIVTKYYKANTEQADFLHETEYSNIGYVGNQVDLVKDNVQYKKVTVNSELGDGLLVLKFFGNEVKNGGAVEVTKEEFDAVYSTFA